MSNFTITFRILVIALFFAGVASAQKFMGIGTDKPNPRSVLELKVEDPTNFQQGFLPPKLTTTQRTSFAGVLTAGLSGMTVYDTNLNAFFVWDGTSWQQLAVSAGSANITALGINGVTVTASGLSLTINGANLVNVSQLVTPKDIIGDYTNGFTVTGLYNAPLNKSSITPNTLLMFDGTSIVGFNSSQILTTATGGFGPDLTGSFGSLSVTGIQGYSILGTPAAGDILSFNGANFVYTPFVAASAQITSIIGMNGVSISGTDLTGFTIDGANLVKTVTGSGLAVITPVVGGYNVSVDGSTFVQTITGSGGIIVGSILGGYSIDGSNISSTSVVGVSGLTVLGTGSSLSVSGAGMVILQQSLVNPVGSSAASFNTTTGTAMLKSSIYIPVGVSKLSLQLNTYLFDASSSADLVIMLNGVQYSTQNLSTGLTSPDNITTLPDLDVTGLGGSTVLLKVFGKVNGPQPAVYVGGITLTVKN